MGPVPKLYELLGNLQTMSSPGSKLSVNFFFFRSLVMSDRQSNGVSDSTSKLLQKLNNSIKSVEQEMLVGDTVVQMNKLKVMIRNKSLFMARPDFNCPQGPWKLRSPLTWATCYVLSLGAFFLLVDVGPGAKVS